MIIERFMNNEKRKRNCLTTLCFIFFGHFS